MWCCAQTLTLLMFIIVVATRKRPRLPLLWPMLINQSAYGVGILILTLAGLPKVLPLVRFPFAQSPPICLSSVPDRSNVAMAFIGLASGLLARQHDESIPFVRRMALLLVCGGIAAAWQLKTIENEFIRHRS